MYGLKDNIDLSFLKDREVIQVAIGTYQVIFAFDEDVTVSVEGQFEYSPKSGAVQWRPAAPHVAASTVGLLGAKVESLHSDKDGTVVLSFSNGDRLVLRDVSKEYESYQITHRGGTIVV